MGMTCQTEGLRVSCVKVWPQAQGQWDTPSFLSQGEAQASPPLLLPALHGWLGAPGPLGSSCWLSPDSGICHRVSQAQALGTQPLTQQPWEGRGGGQGLHYRR